MKKLILNLVITLAILISPLFFTSCTADTNLSALSKNLTNYNISIDFNCQSKQFTASQQVDYINSTDSILTEVRFHLYPNAFKTKDNPLSPVSSFSFERAYKNGFDSGYIVINEVKVQDKSVQIKLEAKENSILVVELDSKLYPDERVNIQMQYIVKVPNVCHRFGYDDNTINVGNFYPVACVFENGAFVQDGYHYNGDPFYSEMANYFVDITYDKGFYLASTGEKRYDNSVKDRKEKQICSALAVRDFAFVLSDKFIEQKFTINNIDVTYLHYNDQDVEQSIDVIANCLSYFNNLIGQYPYKTYTVVQANFLHGGMEYPNLVLISDEIQSRDDINNVIVHETAHQWFYNLIGNNEYSEAWLDEGLTEYVTTMFFQAYDKYGIDYNQTIGTMLSSYQMFVEIYTDVFSTIDTSMNRPLSSFASEPEYTYCVYIKGVLMLDNLRSYIGDSAFMLGLKNYFNENKFKIAKQHHFIAAFNKASGKDISKLIEPWLNGSAILGC